MKKLTCDICGFKHKTAVYVCADGVRRCKVCRRKLQYGKYVDDDTAFERHKAGDSNPRYEPDPDADRRAKGLR